MASPCAVAMPTRRPVKEPGPAATAKSSTSSIRSDAAASTRIRSSGRRSPCVLSGSPVSSASTSVPRSAATLPARVVVSSDRMIKIPMLYFAQNLPEMSSPPVSSEPAGATPAMRQYFEAKRQHRDAIVFFRMGDFYEMFYEDALTAARALELTLTSRSKDASGGAPPLCGAPHHAGDGHHAPLVRQGFRVAVCEQVEDPRKVKGLVRREVVRVVSPGTLTDSNYLEAREPALIVALAPSIDGHGLGAALLDLSTGEFTTAEYAGDAGRQ